MDIKDIPQDNSASYQGHQKIIYATRDGHYEKSTSTGWDDESFATEQAGEVLHRLAHQARQAVERGEQSPLYYLMYAYRHDEASLAMAAGVFKWQLRRHFRPTVFAKLPIKTLNKYAEAFQITVEQLQHPFTAAAQFAPEAHA